MLDKLINLFTDTNWLTNEIRYLFVFILALLSYYIIRKIFIPILRKAASSTKTKIDDILFQKRILHRISLFAPLMVLQAFTYLLPEYQTFLNRMISILYTIVITFTIGAVISTLEELYSSSNKSKGTPLKAYIQVITIFVYIVGWLSVLGIIIGRSPLEIITGLGVFTALLALLFRDPILSFVASLQITSYDLIMVGDWIEVPKYGADGEVIDVSLTVVKIQNWDKTITTIPTYKLIEDSFKNWRGMKLAGTRRIKRSIFIDQSTIKFCDSEMLTRFKDIQLISDYIKSKGIEIESYNHINSINANSIANGRRLTNIGTFRIYLSEYLKKRNDLRQELTLIVRQLQPTSEGLPIELYLFTNTTEWDIYENIQSDIFDHILAVIPQFDLNVFQNPSGNDFKSLKS